MKVYLAYARLCYSLVVIVSGVVALCMAFYAVQGLASWGALSWLFAAAGCLVFLLLCGRAVARKLRGGVLLSQPIGHNQGANFFLMTLLSSFGHLFTAVICNAIYLVVTRTNEMPNPIVFVMALAALCYLAALWVGELVQNK